MAECVEAFDNCYMAEISKGEKSSMNKDFISRVKNDGFKVVSQRVLDLCEFLGVNPYEADSKATISQTESQLGHLRIEFDKVEKVIRNHPDLENKIKTILRSIADIASVQGV
ncbi:hypothetical protein [Pseudoalteromonas ruthenica]|uniref:hypothetical protein n=1 Tax=Pseudoalteromonas ruthenica TaxID=151081 RepID=UPI00110C1295|nr:hypothetical protein [Pseudoalteromonas ruthenica]TMO88112.1 hypothetical protein CWC12_07920 [Pseudoalteromonas ruthenica]TMP24049.1 hypothetical protein CWC06_07090 [Pseudoalteromonas ruthenica]